MNPIFRSESLTGSGSLYPYPYSAITEVEKRQLFLRSYQFSRKQSGGQRVKRSLFRVKKLIWVKLRAAKKIHRMIWMKIRHGFFFSNGFRRKRFIRLNHHHNPSSSLCFW